MFVAHGIPAKCDGDWLIFDRGLPPMTAAIGSQTDHDNSVHVRLDVRAVLPDGRSMFESFVGIGADRKLAAQDAMHAFIQASFHVMLKALYFPSDPHIETKRWMIGGRLRNVVDGQAFIRGSSADGRAALPCLVAFEDRLASIEMSPGLHWLRMYFGQAREQALGGEVLLDNETWSARRMDVLAVAQSRGFLQRSQASHYPRLTLICARISLVD